MKYILILAIAALVTPALNGRFAQEATRKETPNMSKPCPLPGKSGFKCYGFGYIDGVGAKGTIYKCSDCGGRFFDN